MGLSKFFAVVFSVSLLLVAGCPSDQPVTSAAGKPQQATAPPLASPTAQQSPKATLASQPAALPAHPVGNLNPHDRDLIDSVEQAYQSGLSNYRTGKLELAKSDFDRAVDLMLTSKLDIKSDPALSDEFERIVDAVNTLELEALKQGNGFAPKVEPSPTDVANDLTFPVDPNVKAKAIAELKTTRSDLPLVINDPVASYINYFSSRGRGTLLNSLERAGRYHAMIARVLAQEGVPQDLIYQAVAETGFQPQAVNPRTGAGGMWQFMPFSSYGLTRNRWYDERFDPEKSTIAYARYIKSLYNQFGDWYLAMAAYDWGAGNVQRAVERTGYADFWELYRRNVLPQETKNYVPIIIAAAIMAKNPAQYGLTPLVPDPPLVTDTADVDYSVDLRLVSDIVGAPVQEIVGLNPSLLRMATPADSTFELHLPAGTKELYEKGIAEIPVDKRDSWRVHKLAAGDTLASLGHEYHVSASEIAFVNQLDPGDDPSVGDSLIIPVRPVRSSVAGSTRYRIRRGDTLVTLADRFDVTVAQLRRWNHLRSNTLSPGHSLYVAEPAHVSRASRRHRGHHSRHETVRASGKHAKSSATASRRAHKAAHGATQAASGAAGHTHKSSAVHHHTDSASLHD